MTTSLFRVLKIYATFQHLFRLTRNVFTVDFVAVVFTVVTVVVCPSMVVVVVAVVVVRLHVAIIEKQFVQLWLTSARLAQLHQAAPLAVVQLPAGEAHRRG
jgi:hypothetical protein